MSASSFARESRLDTEIQFLKGVGPRWAPLMGKLGITTVRDLLYTFPFRYEDRRNLPPISEVREGEWTTIRGRIHKVESKPIRGGRVIIKATIADDSGMITLSWFNQPWVKKQLAHYDKDLLAFGMVRRQGWAYEMQSPEIELIEEAEDAADFARIVPVYRLTEGLPQRVIRTAASAALMHFLDQVDEPLPAEFMRRLHLRPLRWSLAQIHAPNDDKTMADARHRLVFEEFFYMQLAVQMRRMQAKQDLGITFPLSSPPEVTAGLFDSGDRAGSLLDEIHKIAPFELTGAQKRVIGEIWADMERPTPMNRLLQGDVGSGKTIVAAAAMLGAVRCGYQAAMMAPTEILAEQHFINLHRYFEPLGLTVTLLTGKTPAAKRKKALQQAANGEANIIVGTHALIADGAKFHNLGLCVIDEQHKFGVLQRAALREKGAATPDVLVMTATPIPRTLTMTVYGDMDLSVIDELPPGRSPISTRHFLPHQRERVYQGIRAEIQNGHQAYVVTPLIEESEKVQAQAAAELFARLKDEIFPDLRVGLLHGQLKSAEKEDVMNAFRRHELDILVCTVVIEVGVDVPNATVMVIEDATRFGLAQLHQLRGRVGRGAAKSFCILVGEPRSDDAHRRIRILTETTDGFRIAEEDLSIRGAGEIAGTRQHGDMDLRLGDLIRDSKLLEQARQAAMTMVAADPELAQPAHQGILARVKQSRLNVATITIS